MTIHVNSLREAPRLMISDYRPAVGRPALISQILDGLLARPKSISSMFFYDAAGSKLFEAITRLPEYYLTRTEMGLIRRAAVQIGCALYDTDIVELGSGDCSKIRTLLEAVPAAALGSIRYVPVDVSRSAIEESAAHLGRRFPELHVHGMVADFLSQLELIPAGEKRLFCFFGSTLGNMSGAESAMFFGTLSRIMQPGDRLLLGLDKVKEQPLLEAAYNDSQAVTAAFNRNILNVVNRLAGTDFEPEAFEHVAFYNVEAERIEMHLRASRDMTVCGPHFRRPLEIACGEMIHTENSHKFTDAYIEAVAARTGLQLAEHWMDANEWFSLVQFVKREERCEY